MATDQLAKPVAEAAAALATEAGQQPTTGDLYRAWLDAQDEWAEADAILADAKKKVDAARMAKTALEQKLGAAVVAELGPRDDYYRSRSGFVAMGGRLYYVEETGNDGDGWRYEVRAQEVRKVAV